MNFKLTCAHLFSTFLALAMTVSTSVSSFGQSREIGFVEDFVLSSDRAKTLENLIPGTEAYYYFHCLHFQNTEQFQKVDELVQDWIKRNGRTGLVQQIQNRQALLTYEKDPEKTLAYLKRELNLQFKHQREIPKAELDLPTRLDPNSISYATLAALARKSHVRTEGFTDLALYRLASEDLNDSELQHLIQRLKNPDSDKLVDLIHRELNTYNAQPFGSKAIHRAMTLKQLDAFKAKRGHIVNDTQFVNIYMSKLKPTDDEMPSLERIEYDEPELEAYLDRMWAFVRRLASVHNSLKASVLYHKLKFNLRNGKFDRKLFETYIQLPRQQWYMNPNFLEKFRSREAIANTNANFMPNSLLPPIGNDEPLIRGHLQEFFKAEDDWKAFSEWLQHDYLRTQFAETKIIHGLGDPERWASLLGPEAYKALLNRIDLEFLPGNPQSFDVDQTVKLDLNIKNVDHLIVKIFEINTRNYYQKFSSEIDTDINLDGLVPNWEKTYEYKEVPAKQVLRSFEFKELNRPGVFVIDFIGNGISSRALVRKGHLHFVTEANFAGQQFTIFNWKNEQVKDATIWIGGREFKADKEGLIQVPFSNHPGRKAVVVTHGELSSLGYFNHIGESYQLKAGFYVDRESLLQNRIAKVAVRPTLLTSGWPTPINALKTASLHVKSVNQEGVTAAKTFKKIELSDAFESEFEFGVPARLSTLTFTLEVEVENATSGGTETLYANQSFTINQIDETTSISDLHLVHSDQGYAIDARGKNGNPIAKQAVLVVLKHRMFTQPVVTSFQTDENGRIHLGKLDEIDSLQGTLPGIQRQWALARPQARRFATTHGSLDQIIQVPYSNSDEKDRSALALFEVRSGVIVSDKFDAISVKNGLLTIKGLAAGNYQLIFKNENRQMQICITDGSLDQDVVFGKHRHLEVRNRFPLTVNDIKSDEKHVAIQLGNAGPDTRVHIFATRYQPPFDAFTSLLDRSGMEPFQVNARQSSTSYVIGRNIGDEYRYILDRKFARKYPGNMLTRPSLLLRPWSIDVTQNFVQPPAQGGDFDRSGVDPSDMQNRTPMQQPKIQGAVDASNLDFLARGAAVLTNLKPSENGVIIVDRKLLHGQFNLQIVATDRVWTSRVTHVMNESPIEIADRRLAEAIDPAEHYALRKQHSILKAGDELIVPNTPTSKIQRFDDLSDVYQLLENRTGDSTLSEFRFILQWPGKTDREKRELYSKYACHELNYFIFRKDREFFEQVVKRFIENKKDKTFFDHWLLGNVNDQFLSPWNYQKLNVAERIALSQRLEENRQAVRRNIFDMYLLNPTPIQYHDEFYSYVFGAEGLVTEGKMSGEKRDRGRVNGKGSKNKKDDEKSNLSADAKPRAPSPSRADPNAGPGDMSGGGFGGGGFGGGEVGGGRPGKSSNSYRFRGDEESKIGTKLELESLDRLQQVKDKAAEEHYKKIQSAGKNIKRLKEIRKELDELYRRVEPTKIWVETNYYRLRIQDHTAERVPVNEFWKDYASHEDGAPFLSPHFGQCTSNFSEMMLALAVIDLPFETEKHEQTINDKKVTFKAAGPVIVFHQQVRPSVYERRGSTVLVSENFYRHDDRYQNVDGKRYDKFVREGFLKQVLYGGQVVVTNPTSTPKTVEVLIQIPEGSMPAAGSQESRSVKIDLAAFSTQTFGYHFFFPESGSFEHYPAHVSDLDKVLAVAESLTFKVLDKPRTTDKTSWAFISQNGTDQQVLDYLAANNTLNLDLDKIAFRLRDKTFFQKVIAALNNRMTYHQTSWSYSLFHNDVETINQFLSHQNHLIANCGQQLKSPLVTIDPVERNSYEHREFWPLFNARQHQLGAERQINNPKLWAQYHRYLDVLSCANEATHSQTLALTYYLLLQDRVESALEQFAKVDRSKLAEKMQYDYCKAYLAMYSEDIATAKSIAAKYQQYPVDHWQKHFANLSAQIAEIESDAAAAVVNQEDREQKQTAQADAAPTFEFEVVDQKVKLQYQNLKKVRVNYYKMDIELLFSRNPFVKNQSGSFALIRPNQTQQIDLPADKKDFEFAVPKELANHNVLVEISAAGQSRSSAFYSHTLAVKLTEAYGQVQVRNQTNGKPLSKVYVKVYARMKDGTVKFYKDGYTDLRGRFDYSSLSNQPLDNVSRFSLLILSESNGAIIRQAGLPLE